MIINSISAKTKVFAVIGDPISHSMSPLIQNTTAALRNCDMVYHAMHVIPEDLGAAIKGGMALGISGFNITVPHKKAVMEYLAGIDKQAEAIGAVNTLKLTADGYIGYNTDIIGAYYALMENGIDPAGKTVVVIGAGGAGNACAAMAMSNGAKQVYIANRTLKTAQDLAAHLSKYYSVPVSALEAKDIYNIEQADLVINTTTLGFGDKIGLTAVENTDWYDKAKVSAVFDAIYAPWETAFLAQAKAKGIKAVNGFAMLIYQALAAQEIWFDISFDQNFRQDVCKKITDHYLEGLKK